MSRATRKLARELAATAELDRNRAIDADRADLPWYMQRNWRVIWARFLRRQSSGPHP